MIKIKKNKIHKDAVNIKQAPPAYNEMLLSDFLGNESLLNETRTSKDRYKEDNTDYQSNEKIEDKDIPQLYSEIYISDEDINHFQNSKTYRCISFPHF